MALRKIGFSFSALIVVILAAATLLWAHYLLVPTNVAYVSEEDGGITVIDLGTLKVLRRVQPSEIAPEDSLCRMTENTSSHQTRTQAMSAVFSTPRLRLVTRMHIGANPEFIKINPAGDRLFATFEPGSQGGPPSIEKAAVSGNEKDEPPSQIASFHVGDWALGPVSAAGQETEGLEFSRDGKLMLVANESQDSIGVFDAATGGHVRDVNLKPYGIRPRGVKVSPQGNGYAVTMEGSGTLVMMDLNLKVIKSVPTAAKPYGLAFDRAGKRIFVSAALSGKLQVFSADSLQLLAEVSTGKRCWHFTFTPDDSRILLACGRSNNIVAIDANSYKQIGTIEGFKLPWGIVTYPRSYGSLELP